MAGNPLKSLSGIENKSLAAATTAYFGWKSTKALSGIETLEM
jgi:hypothetical protein